jgi:hypothetical protein
MTEPQGGGLPLHGGRVGNSAGSSIRRCCVPSMHDRFRTTPPDGWPDRRDRFADPPRSPGCSLACRDARCDTQRSACVAVDSAGQHRSRFGNACVPSPCLASWRCRCSPAFVDDRTAKRRRWTRLWSRRKDYARGATVGASAARHQGVGLCSHPHRAIGFDVPPWSAPIQARSAARSPNPSGWRPVCEQEVR